MKIKSFKIFDNDKFRKGMTISFRVNSKRRDNLFWLFKDTTIARWAVVIGKNSAGKSSIYQAIANYFAIINAPDFTTNKMAFWQEPRYEVIYIADDNVHIKHQITAVWDNYKRTLSFEQKVFTQKSYGPVFWPQPILKNGRRWFLNCPTSKNENVYLEQLFGFIKTSQIANNINDVLAINSRLAAYDNNLSSQGDKFFKFLTGVLKAVDSNFVKFDFQKGIRLAINIGEKNRLIEISQLSQGTLNAIILVLKIFTIQSSQYGGLLIYDNWEAHLNHQMAWKILVATIDSDKLQGFTTSHAPAMFDNLFRYDMLYEVNNENGALKIATFAEKYHLRSDKRVSHFFATNIITSPEDFEDMTIDEKNLKKNNTNSGFSHIQLQQIMDEYDKKSKKKE